MHRNYKIALLIILAIAIIGMSSCGLAFGNALGGGSLRAFSHDYEVEADSHGGDQIIVNGRGNDVAVPLAEDSNTGRPLAMTVVAYAATLLFAYSPLAVMWAWSRK